MGIVIQVHIVYASYFFLHSSPLDLVFITCFMMNYLMDLVLFKTRDMSC